MSQPCIIQISSSQEAMRVPRKRIRQLIPFVGEAEGIALGEIDVAVVTAEEIERLNRRWLSHGGTTDVISFDLSEPHGEAVSCQIVVCGDVAVEQAARHGHGVQRELLLYITHGLLHVMGYDDRTEAKARRMRQRQEELLRRFLEG